MEAGFSAAGTVRALELFAAFGGAALGRSKSPGGLDEAGAGRGIAAAADEAELLAETASFFSETATVDTGAAGDLASTRGSIGAVAGAACAGAAARRSPSLPSA